MQKRLFGTMPDGTPVEQYTLTAGALSCEVLTFGGTLRSLRVPDRTGQVVDVLLGLDRLEDYLSQDKFLGALVGRYANRIGGASFDLNGIHYPLGANDGVNHLHGGAEGYSRRIWTVKEAGEDFLVLTLFSPDGDEGYPGNLSVQVEYRLEETGLTIDYQATADRDTLCNLTSHAYFNLAGHDSGPISRQTIRIPADRYTPTDAGSIPTGELADVAGTPLDLREETPIGAHVDDDFPQLTLAGGYDHNWVLNGETGVLHPAATAYSPDTGLELQVLTTLPGIQFYSGNYLDGCPAGKGGAPYAKRWAFCLETQFFPARPPHPDFPSAVLKAGETWRHTTVYRFAVR